MVEMSTVPAPRFRLLYNTKDITVELSPYIVGLAFTDVLENESDELEVSIEDRDHRWQNDWFPGRGDRLQLAFGYAGHPLANMGGFEIDEIEFTGLPDTICIRALSAGVTEALRTGNTVAHEEVTLRTIAEQVAAKHGLQLVGTGEATGRTYQRVTQHLETDVAFLRRLGQAEGIIFSIKDGQLVWHDRDALDAAAAITVIRRTDTLCYTFRAKTATTYKACQVSYHDPKTKSLVTYTEPAADVPSGDTLKLVERCETMEQARGKAKAALRGGNGRQVEGSMALYGNPSLRAGVNIEAQGFGRLDGIYQIQTARHAVDRGGGYTTEIEFSTNSSQGRKLQ